MLSFYSMIKGFYATIEGGLISVFEEFNILVCLELQAKHQKAYMIGEGPMASHGKEPAEAALQ